MKPQLELDMLGNCCSGNFKPVERDIFGVEPNLECDKVTTCCVGLPDWHEIQVQSGGYHFPCTTNIPSIPSLPKIISSIKWGNSHLKYKPALGKSVWAVPYSSVLKGDLKNTQQLNGWLEQKDLIREPLVLLHQETHDDYLARLYPKTFDPNFFTAINSAPNCITIAPGYSVYDDGTMCRHYQLLNMKRSVEFFVRACESGVPCIPYFGWNLPEDLSRIAKWVNAHPTLRYVAINTQTLGKNAYDKLATEMKVIEAASRPLQWVVFGGRVVIKHLSANGFADRLSLVTSALFHAANVKRSYDKTFYSTDQVELFKHNYDVAMDAF